jgi:hypothetical protein
MTPIERARRLRKLSGLNSQAELDEFDAHIEALIDEPDGATLAELFRAFDDAASDPGLMYRLLKLVESVPDDRYVLALVQALPAMLARASGWAARLLGRVIASEATRGSFRRAIPTMSSEERTVADTMMSELAQSYAHLVDHIVLLRQTLAARG